MKYAHSTGMKIRSTSIRDAVLGRILPIRKISAGTGIARDSSTKTQKLISRIIMVSRNARRELSIQRIETTVLQKASSTIVSISPDRPEARMNGIWISVKQMIRRKLLRNRPAECQKTARNALLIPNSAAAREYPLTA